MVQLNEAALEAISKSAGDGGGFQRFMKKLQGQIKYDKHKQAYFLQYDDDDLKKIQQYAQYCPGGFEDRFQAILSCIQQQS